MKTFLILLKYELFNVFRNRWLMGYSLFLFIMTLSLMQFGGDDLKMVMSLLNLSLILVPSVCLLFSTVYWYGSESFVQMLLSQPIRRSSLWAVRWLSLFIVLSITYALGTILPLAIKGFGGQEVFQLLLWTTLLNAVFISIGLSLSSSISDRLKGMGSVLVTLFYFVIVHDGIIFIVLTTFNRYPLEIPVLSLVFLNPISLVRLLGLLHFDTAALMGYTGVILQRMLGQASLLYMGFVGLLIWVFVPMFIALKIFKRKDI